MPSEPRIRAVFFDLDDTLCDTIGTREARARLAFEALAGERLGLDVEALVVRVMAPCAGDLAVRGLPAVLLEMGLEDGAAFSRALGIWFFSGCEELLRAFEGVEETVAQLSRRYRLGVITNGPEEMQRAKLRQISLEPYIRHFVVSETVGYEKPDARIFEHALSLAGVDAREAVFVGDRLDVDVRGAQGAGMRSVWFSHWGGSLDGASARPEAVIRRFGELPGALAEIRRGRAQ